jgi:hypothetical protein
MSIEVEIEIIQLPTKRGRAWFWKCPCPDCEHRYTVHGPFTTERGAKQHAQATYNSYALEAAPENVAH